MENFMKNEILQPVIETLQCKVNSTLGIFAKTLIERNDYETLGYIANIGNDLNTYIDGIFQTYSSPNAVIVINDKVVDETVETPIEKPAETTNNVAEVHEVPQEIVTEDISTETLKSTKRTCVRGGYGVEINVVEKWVKEYLFKRGGRALKNDLYDMFYKTFSNQFNAYDLSNGSDKPKWKQNVCDRIQTMRKNGIVAKSENGTEWHYYTLTPEYYANLKKSIQVQPTLPYTSEKEMTSEG
jgi:hypothetical protein